MKRRNARILGAAVAMCAMTASFQIPGPAIGGAGVDDEPFAIVALGDSLASGLSGRWKANSVSFTGSHDGTDRAYAPTNDPLEDSDYDPWRIYGNSYDNGCYRSDVAPIMKTRLPHKDEHTIRRFNLACSGATTYNLMRQEVGGESWRDEKPQIDQLADIAKNHKVLMISLSIGGNDVGFGEIASACVSRFITGDEHCGKEGQEIVDLHLSSTIRRVRQTIQDIRNVMRAAGHSDNDYRIILNSVPPMIPRAQHNRYPESGWSRVIYGGCPMWDEDLNWINDSIDELAESLEAIAFVKGIDYVNLRPAFEGREACAMKSQLVTADSPPDGSKHEWARFATTGYYQGEVSESFHPNYFGQIAISECLTQIMASPASASFTCRNQDGRGPEHMTLEVTRAYRQ